MRRMSIVLAAATLVVAVLAVPSSGRDRPFSTSTLHLMKLLPPPQAFEGSGGQTDAGGQFSKQQIERFTCDGGTPAGAALDISCNDTTYGQDWAPDNEIAIAVDPEDPDHLLAGSNDYYYRFNNSTGARQALVPTGFFTSFDGGETWLDGQIPFGSGNGNGDPAPAFDAKHDVGLMAQLGNVGGQGGPWVAAGNVSVSRSLDGGVTWQPPVTVFHGSGAGIGPANNAVFWDKVFMGVDNNVGSPFFGRIYVTASRFQNGLQGSYAESPIWLSSSDDGGVTWTSPKEISGSNPSCTFQSSGPEGECDEDQDSDPVVASDGTLYVYFLNGQNDAEWEVPFDFDNQVMVVKSTDGGETFSPPVAAAQLEDGLSDMPFSVIIRQTIYGHQIRWGSFGNLSTNPTDPDDIVVTWSDRGAPNPNAGDGSCLDEIPGAAPNYDPCDAGPGSTVNVYMARSTDGGDSWSPRTAVARSSNSQWFPWAGHLSDGTLVVGFDQDTAPAPADTFRHVLSVGGAAGTALGPLENIDVSVTHWAGQYTTAWPAVCGPAGYTDPPWPGSAEGKDCNVFHGDYTGLAVGPDDAIHVVWTGLNRFETSPQLDVYTGAEHDGYAQDAMYRQVNLTS
jgi:hypothetical protein